MEVPKIAGVLALALSLVLGLASPALAAPPNWAPPQAGNMLPALLMGEVVEIDTSPQIFVIQSGWWEVTVSVDGETQYYKASVPAKAVPLAKQLMELGQESQGRLGLQKWLHSLVGRAGSFFRAVVPWGAPGLVKHQPELGEQGQGTPGLGRWLRPFGEEATFDDITVGSQVVVRAVPGKGNPVAKLVIIVEPTGYGRVVGTITDISSADKTITIAPDDGGEEIVLSYDEETCFILRGIVGLEEGQRVRAIYDAEDMIAKVVFAPVEAE